MEEKLTKEQLAEKARDAMLVSGDREMVEKCLDMGLDPNTLVTVKGAKPEVVPLWYISYVNGDVDDLRLFVAKGTDINAKFQGVSLLEAFEECVRSNAIAPYIYDVIDTSQL